MIRCRPSLDDFLGVPYDQANCVELTRRYLAACGVDMPDPSLEPHRWEACEQSQALVVTYRARTHIAAVIGQHMLETRKNGTSCLMPLRRMAKMGLEYWRLRE